MYVFWNPSPKGIRVGDCSIRALSKVLDKDWETVYLMLCLRGYAMSDLPNSNAVIDSVLKDNGYFRQAISPACKDCYTIGDFANEYPSGKYVVGTGSHVVAVADGNIYDSWDSQAEMPIYFWSKQGE